ncbi:CcdB family protein [Roseobacter sinensis]|uniref:Toxin CcdB n=1 Tax=Roseobacter sinensis TaxID=2931391 RepID=A0ABT3BK79_9RHOB|nr:CcdB family protein [Roseobacter sp. WL0113]MCV3273961.1 CcdB family protein [Roseobacter sp. WL0113]
MARHDVYPNPEGTGYIIDLQSDLLSALNTRVVAPLMPRDSAPQPAQWLNPMFEIEGQSVILVTQFMAAVPCTLLRTPVATLEAEHAAITRAVDMVMQGF